MVTFNFTWVLTKWRAEPKTSDTVLIIQRIDIRKLNNKKENSESRKAMPHVGFHEISPVWVKSGSNRVWN